MLIFNNYFFVRNELIWSCFILGIKKRIVLKSELNGLHENVQHFDPWYIGSREMNKTKKATTLRDTLYVQLPFYYDIFSSNQLLVYAKINLESQSLR